MYTICTYLIYYEGTKAAMEWALETKHRETEFNSSQTYEIQTADFQVCRNLFMLQGKELLLERMWPSANRIQDGKSNKD